MTQVETAPMGYEARPTALGHASGMLVRGEVDLGTAPDLSERLDVAIRESEGTFLVDLSDLAFLDSTGITVFIRARALLGREERQLAIVCPPGAVRRVFDLTGCSDLFALFESNADAAAAGVGA
jgi:anti-anti-sigma factor